MTITIVAVYCILFGLRMIIDHPIITISINIGIVVCALLTFSSTVVNCVFAITDDELLIANLKMLNKKGSTSEIMRFPLNEIIVQIVDEWKPRCRVRFSHGKKKYEFTLRMRDVKKYPNDEVDFDAIVKLMEHNNAKNT